MITINDRLFLKNFDSDEDNWVIDEINNESKSDMINDIQSHLILSHKSKLIDFNNAYLVKYNNEIIGYVYISSKSMGKFYFEYLLFKKYRGQGLGTYILGEITDKIMVDNPDIKECHLSIYKSNIASMKAANNNYFYEEENDYNQDRIEFIKDNPYFLNKIKRF